MKFALACAMAQALCAGSPTAHADDDGSFVLITRDFQVKSIRLAELTDRSVVHMEESRGWVTLDLQQCVALLNPAAEDSGPRPAEGLVILADGQRLPGEPVIGADAVDETLAWSHPWLGRLNVPLRLVEAVLLKSGAVAPQAGNADVVVLANGDRQEGFVTAIGDEVRIEVGAAGQADIVKIPMERVTAISMVAPRQAGKGRRVWFAEGTVLDVDAIAVGEDQYVRLKGNSVAGDAADDANGLQPSRVALSDVAAILFDRNALIALASLTPLRVEGPATRYVLRKPTIREADAPLGLSAIDYSGPLVTRYAVPAACERFIAEAELPREDREWGDCELVIRSDDEQVFRVRLNAATPTASVNVPLKGRELTIEVAGGAHGPIQDLVRLHRPMLLKGR